MSVTAIGPDSIAETEWQVRVDLAAAYRLAAHFDMDDVIYTHFSARIPDGSGDFLLNPYGLMFEEITATSLIRVTPVGEMVGQSEFDLNFFGYKIHEPFYRMRADIGAVLHTHTRAGIAVSAMKCGLLPISQMSLQFHDAVGYHAYEGNSFAADEQQRLIDNLGGTRAAFLRNHGLLTLGETVPEAFSRLYYLEESCRVQVDAMAGGELELIPQTAADEVASGYRKLGMPVSKREWPAFLRLLDRHNPGYAD